MNREAAADTLRVCVEDCRAGRCSFEDFVKRSLPSWERYARYLQRRWKGPWWHDREDVVQDLLFAAWDAIWNFDPALAPGGDEEVLRYVVWNALDKAKKKIHKHRGAKLHGNADASPGRWDVPFSTFETEPTARANVDSAEHVLAEIDEVLAACKSERERNSVRAILQTGSLEEAARLIAEADIGARNLYGGIDDLYFKVVQDAAGVVSRMSDDEQSEEIKEVA